MQSHKMVRSMVSKNKNMKYKDRLNKDMSV